MFVTHGIPSFFELLRKCVHNCSQRISLSSNSIIVACLAPSVFIHSPVRQWWRSVLRRVSRGGGQGACPPPLEIEKQKKKKKKIIRANIKLFHLYFATFLVENVFFSASF